MTTWDLATALGALHADPSLRVALLDRADWNHAAGAESDL